MATAHARRRSRARSQRPSETDRRGTAPAVHAVQSPAPKHATRDQNDTRRSLRPTRTTWAAPYAIAASRHFPGAFDIFGIDGYVDTVRSRSAAESAVDALARGTVHIVPRRTLGTRIEPIECPFRVESGAGA